MKKMLAHAKHLPTHQPLHRLWTVFAAESDSCYGASAASLDSSQHLFLHVRTVYGGPTQYSKKWLFFFSFSFFMNLCAGNAENQTSPSIVLFFQFSLLYLICNFFYLYWLFLIGFYFLFNPWIFNFIWFLCWI